MVEASAAVLRGAGIAAEVASEIGRAGALASAERAALDRIGAAAITWDDDRYPARLRPIADPPLALMVRGSIEAIDDPAVAIVGARRAGEYGRRVADDLARGLAQAGITVVSGLATGVDAAAHRGALAAGGRTIAVMATGIDRVYPTWNRGLGDQIAGRGALVTEFPWGTPPLHFHFPRRNRIISGVSVGTVVVEAAERSGSLITAHYALEQGREVFAVPGPVGVPQHAGCHRLIQQGAKLVTSVEDVLTEIAPALVGRVRAARAAIAAASVTAAEQRLLGAIGDGAAHVDDVVARAGVDAGAALETLLALELRGLVEQRPGMRFVRRQVA
ncbi:MAG TPA: DNA-processing protein DprA [Candidatus Eisenbacteria bacterium]|nr:DNA-processing protein DprA [Candidatus Eisenbacteria bacterium]